MNYFAPAACVVILLSAAFPSSSCAGSRSWVASTGDNNNICSRAAPCLTIAGALAKTNAGGEITCADSGNFPIFNIDKSITINCEGVVATSEIATSSQSAIVINVAATDRVILRGFDIDRMAGGFSGISFTGAGTLILDRMKISNARSDTLSGVEFTPNGPAKLIVTDSLIASFGGNTSGAGILVRPQPGGSAQVALERVKVSSSTFGIAADGGSSTAGINMTIADSLVASNTNDGIVATTSSGHAPIGVMVKNTKSANNGYGIRAIGPNATVRVDGSTIAGNGTGLTTSSGGALLSYGNNNVDANGANGSFSGSIAVK